MSLTRNCGYGIGCFMSEQWMIEKLGLPNHGTAQYAHIRAQLITHVNIKVLIILIGAVLPYRKRFFVSFSYAAWNKIMEIMT
jgi:hypothetical protein